MKFVFSSDVSGHFVPNGLTQRPATEKPYNNIFLVFRIPINIEDNINILHIYVFKNFQNVLDFGFLFSSILN